jgi:hypothetical protein
VAAIFRELELCQGIFNWAQGYLTREEVYKLLLTTDNDGRIFFHMAARFRELEVFERIFNWVKKNITREEVKNYYPQLMTEGRSFI